MEESTGHGRDRNLKKLHSCFCNKQGGIVLSDSESLSREERNQANTFKGSEAHKTEGLVNQENLKMWTNTIQNIDCLDGLKKLPDRCVDLIIADPPYFKTINETWDFKWRTEEDYLKWAEKWIKELSRVAKPTACFYLFGYFRVLYLMVPLITKHNFELRQQIIVDKGMKSVSGRKTSTYKLFPTTTESILFFNYDNKPNIKKFLKDQQKITGLSAKEINEKLGVKSNGGGVWSLYTGENILAQVPTKEMWEKLEKVLNFKKDYSEITYVYNIQMGYSDVWNDIDFYEEERNHRTQKPVKLIERLIRASSNPGHLILDPFMGSGSTAVAAKKLNRKFIGFEIDRQYYEESLKRLQQTTLA